MAIEKRAREEIKKALLAKGKNGFDWNRLVRNDAEVKWANNYMLGDAYTSLWDANGKSKAAQQQQQGEDEDEGREAEALPLQET